MIKSISSIIFLAILIIACKGKQNSNEQYYPIGYFLKQELAIIDSFHLPITRIQRKVNVDDSSIINTEEFKKIVDETLLNNLSDPASLNDYEESTIHDLQLDLITISYTSPDKKINKIDVYIDPKNEKVKSIFVIKQEENGDVLVTQKILWTAGSQLLITAISNSKDGITTSTARYNWSSTGVK